MSTIHLDELKEEFADLPARPLLAPWQEYVVDHDRLIVRYAEGAVVFEGTASTLLLPRVLERLDGRRSAADIVAELGGAARPAIAKALRQLAEHGLLLEGIESDLAAAPRRTLFSLSEATGGALSPDAVARHLASVHPVLLGTGPQLEALTDLFARADIHVTTGDPGEGGSESVERLVADHDPIVVAPASPNSATPESVNRWALATGRSWSLVLPYDGRFAVVGPQFVPERTGCYQCFRLRRRSQLGFLEVQGSVDAAADRGAAAVRPQWSDPGQEAVVAGLAFHLLLLSTLPTTHVAPPLAGKAYTVSWAMPGVALDAHTLYRVPRCRDCGRTTSTGTPQPWFETTDTSLEPPGKESS